MGTGHQTQAAADLMLCADYPPSQCHGNQTKSLSRLERGVVRAGEALAVLIHYLQGAYVTDVDILLKQRWANC
jgi:hypothetical protein